MSDTWQFILRTDQGETAITRTTEQCASWREALDLACILLKQAAVAKHSLEVAIISPKGTRFHLFSRQPNNG